VLPLYRDTLPAQLIANISDRAMAPTEVKVRELPGE